MMTSKDWPIIMSAPMVRGVAKECDEPGTGKTHTRRIAMVKARIPEGAAFPSRYTKPSQWQAAKAGDLLWVRENWKPHSLYAGMKPRDIPCSKVFYKADKAYAPSNTPWVPSIHMPRWASRFTLTLTEVRIEPLQAITEQDCAREGLWFDGGLWHCPGPDGGVWHSVPTGKRCFKILWEKLNGAGSWDLNPEVVVLAFRPERGNIDSPSTTAQPAEGPQREERTT